MALTTTPRFGLQQWGASTDGPTRAQFNASFLAVDTKGAMAWQGLKAHVGSLDGGLAHHDRQLVYATDTQELFWDDGSAFLPLPTFQSQGNFVNRQTINSPSAPQMWLQNGDSDTTHDTQLRLQRSTSSDGTAYRRLQMILTANVLGLYVTNTAVTGVNSDLSGMSGRWAINWASDTPPTDTLVIKNRTGTEIARFAEGGFVGIGTNNPTAPLHIKSAQATAMRIGSVTGAYDNAMTFVPNDEHTMTMMFGGDYAGAYVARSTSVGMLQASSGSLVYYANAGLGVNGSFTPTQRWSVDIAGTMRTRQIVVGLGAYDGTTLRGTMGDFGSSDTIYLLAQQTSGATAIALQPNGAGSVVYMQPEGLNAASFYKSGSSANMMAAMLGYTILGASVSGFNWPAVRVVRVGGTLDGSGNGSATHGIASFNAGNVVMKSASCRGNSGEAVTLNVVAVDSSGIGVSGGIAGRVWRAALMYSESTADW